MVFELLVVAYTRMHVVLDFKCIKHERVVQPDPMDDVSLLHHLHDHLLLLECKVLEHLFPLVNQLCRLDLLDCQLVEKGDLKHTKDDLESLGVVAHTEKLVQRGQREVIA